MQMNDIGRQLDSLLDHCQSMASDKDNDPIWQQDVIVLTEMKDILHDYDLQSRQIQMMVNKYETPHSPIKKSAELWLCTSCGHRVNPKYSHCHWCGAMFQEATRRRRGRR